MFKTYFFLFKLLAQGQVLVQCRGTPNSEPSPTLSQLQRISPGILSLWSSLATSLGGLLPSEAPVCTCRGDWHTGLARWLSAAYLSLLVTILDAQSVHGPDDGCQGLDGVAIDDRLVLFHVFSREAIFMDNPGEKPHTHTHRMSALCTEHQACEVPGPIPWPSWLRAGSKLDVELLSCCINTTKSEGENLPD